MRSITYKDAYTTSPIPSDDLIAGGFLHEDDDVFEEYLLETRQNKTGGWDIYRLPPYGAPQLAKEGMNCDGALSSLIYLEGSVITDSNEDKDDKGCSIIDISVFAPENYEEVPEARHIESLKNYINTFDLPENHILRFALELGENKLEVDTICSKSNIPVATKTGVRGAQIHMN